MAVHILTAKGRTASTFATSRRAWDCRVHPWTQPAHCAGQPAAVLNRSRRFSRTGGFYLAPTLCAIRHKKKAAHRAAFFVAYGGEGGIRTHGALTRTPDFESGTFDHSATSPVLVQPAGRRGAGHDTGLRSTRQPRWYIGFSTDPQDGFGLNSPVAQPRRSERNANQPPTNNESRVQKISVATAPPPSRGAKLTFQPYNSHRRTTMARPSPAPFPVALAPR